MGEFKEAVSRLLDAFASGIAIIKTQRGRRKREQVVIDERSREAERVLSRSLRKSRVDVKSAYGRDLKRFGEGFEEGDEAHTSLSSILFRLNAGFVSVIERFTRGRSTATDYQALLNLSNASRMEAISTFSQLSYRLSTSSLALSSTTSIAAKPKRRRRTKEGLSKSKSKEVVLASTPLGPAKKEGWVRAKGKGGRKGSSSSTSSASSLKATTEGKAAKTGARHSPSNSKSRSRSPQIVPALPAPPKQKQLTALPLSPPPAYQTHQNHQLASPPHPHSQFTHLSPPLHHEIIDEKTRQKELNRKSIMSFASGSTKIGEIPESRWRERGKGSGGEFPIVAVWPVEKWEEPERKGVLRRLFRRS